MKKKILLVTPLFLFAVASLLAQQLSWQDCAEMPDVRRNHALCSVAGKAYLLGGYDANIGLKNSNFEYDPLSDSWTEKTPMSCGRSNFGAVPIDGKVFVTGGDPFRKRTEMYDPQTNTWTTMTSMPTGRQHAKCVSVGHEVFVISGLETGWNYTDVTEVFNTDSNTWETRTPIPEPRDLYGAVSFNGKVYIFGGCYGIGYCSTTYCYHVATDSWSTKSPMLDARYGMGTVVCDDKIYLLGGANEGGALSSVMVYDPVADSWSYSDNMQTPRRLTDATSLNGNIFVVGGCTSNAVAYNTCEIGSFSNVGIETNKMEQFKLIGATCSKSRITIDFELKKQSLLEYCLYDMKGRKIASTNPKIFPKGVHSITENRIPDHGVYMLSVKVDGRGYSKKFLLR